MRLSMFSSISRKLPLPDRKLVDQVRLVDPFHSFRQLERRDVTARRNDSIVCFCQELELIRRLGRAELPRFFVPGACRRDVRCQRARAQLSHHRGIICGTQSERGISVASLCGPLKDQPRCGNDAVRDEFVSLLRRVASSPGGNCRSAGRVAMQANKSARGASAEGFSERPDESTPTASAAVPESDVSADAAVATAAPPTIVVASAGRIAIDSGSAEFAASVSIARVPSNSALGGAVVAPAVLRPSTAVPGGIWIDAAPAVCAPSGVVSASGSS
jgi:hypothetical protein